MNFDIQGISKLKWTGIGELNSDDYYIYYCRQESIRRNGVAIMVNKRVPVVEEPKQNPTLTLENAATVRVGDSSK